MSSIDSTHGSLTRAVLGIVISSRYAGYAVLDGFGLPRQRHVAPAGTWDLRAAKTLLLRAATIRTNLARTLRWHRPLAVVIGLDPNEDQLVCEAVLRTCSRYVPRVVVECPYAGLRALGWSRHVTMHAVAERLTRHFVPELTHELRRYSHHRPVVNNDVWRYRRTAWQAAALALRELARVRPWAAAALVRERPPRIDLIDEIEAGVQLAEPATHV